jgi:4-hydroxy-3-polyprenylbenzoate decarboxylase
MATRNCQRKGKRYFRDLRDFIAQLEQTGNLHRITDRIEKNSELMPLVRWQYQGLSDDQRKAFLFANVTDPEGKSYDCRVAVGVRGTSRVIYVGARTEREKRSGGVAGC